MEQEINVIDARDLIREDEKTRKMQLLDVRSKEAFEESSIPGFMNIPLSEVSHKVPSLDGKKATLIICNDGSLSKKAQVLLEACGYKSTIIRGGLNDWRAVINPDI